MKQFELLHELDLQEDLYNTYCLTEGVEILKEAVADLVQKIDQWQNSGNVSADDIGNLVAGLDVLTGKNRSVVTADDLRNMNVHPDLRNLQRLDNVDLNSVIRSHIMKVGKVLQPTIAKNVAQLAQSTDGRKRVAAALNKIARRVNVLRQKEVKRKGSIGPSSGNSLKDKWAMKKEQRLSPGIETTSKAQPRMPGYARRDWSK